MTVIIDSREPSRLKVLLKKKGVETKGDYLQIGDYLLPNSTIIERKTSADFLASIFDKRIWIQANNMSQYEHPIIAIIAGNKWKDFYFRKGKYIHKTWIGTIATLSCKYNISVITFEDEDEFLDYLKALDSKLSTEKESTRMDSIVRKPKNDTEVKENIIAAIPNIGIKTAQDIINKYKTVSNVCNTSISDLIKIDGIGPKTAEEIYKYLH